jgi:hypothetical protein
VQVHNGKEASGKEKGRALRMPSRRCCNCGILENDRRFADGNQWTKHDLENASRDPVRFRMSRKDIE